jgi:hypothetical protein
MIQAGVLIGCGGYIANVQFSGGAIPKQTCHKEELIPVNGALLVDEGINRSGCKTVKWERVVRELAV